MTKKANANREFTCKVVLIKLVTKTYTQYKVGVNEFALSVTKMEFELMCDKLGATLKETSESGGNIWHYYY